MAIIFNNDIVQVKFFSSQGTQQGINVINFRAANAIGGGLTDQAAADLISNLFAPLYKSWMSTSAEYRGVRLQIKRPIPAPAVVSLDGAGLGAVVSPQLPSQCAVCVRLLTGVFGRQNQGRAYLPFWASSFCITGGQLTVAGKNLAELWATPLTAPVNLDNGLGNSVDLVPGIDSKGSIDPPTPAHFTPINQFEVDIYFATQVRRSNLNRPDQIGPTTN